MLKLLLLLLIFICVYALWMVMKKVQKKQRAVQRSSSYLINNQHVAQADVQKNELKDFIDPDQKRLFDNMAQLFLQQHYCLTEIQQGQVLQQEWLSKMPLQTVTEVRQLDLGEWSIVWSLAQQSLEYYVGTYGWFYTHVDLNGVEHRNEIRQPRKLN